MAYRADYGEVRSRPHEGDHDDRGLLRKALVMENLEIYNNLREVPKEAQKTIGAGRLKGMTDINPMWRIKALTEQFGACGEGWYYDILDKQTYEVGGEIVATVDIKLYYKIDNVWSRGIFGTGGSKLVAKESKGLYVNDEAFKMALTDAISVAGKSIGLGADIYWNKDNTKYNDNKKAAELEEDRPISKTEVKTLTQLSESYKVNTADICKRYNVSKLEDLSYHQYGAALRVFKSMEKKA